MDVSVPWELGSPTLILMCGGGEGWLNICVPVYPRMVKENT